RQTLQVRKHHRGAELRRQPVHRLRDFAVDDRFEERALRVRVPELVQGAGGGERFRLVVEDTLRYLDAPPPLLLPPEEGVATDREQPCPAARAGSVGVPVAIGAEEGLLHEVVRLLLVAGGQPQPETVYGVQPWQRFLGEACLAEPWLGEIAHLPPTAHAAPLRSRARTAEFPGSVHA